MEDIFSSFIQYFLEIAPAFLIAILISAALVELIPDSFYDKVLKKKRVFNCLNI